MSLEKASAEFGSSGAIHGPMIAMTVKKTRIVRPMMPPLERSIRPSAFIGPPT